MVRQFVVGADELAHRPVAAPHHAFRPERFEQVIRPRARAPAHRRCRASVTSPESLQIIGRLARERRDVLLPRLEVTRGDGWFGAVIEHHRQIRIPSRELEQRRRDVSAAPARRTRDRDRASLRTRVRARYRSIQSGSGMSWIMGRRPTSFGSAASSAMVSAASALSKSTQPTTPAMNACLARERRA